MILVIVKSLSSSSPSISVSSINKSYSFPLALFKVDPSVTASVSLTPTGSSFIPLTVMVMLPSASSVPSFTLYSKYSFTVSPLSKTSVAVAVAA